MISKQLSQAAERLKGGEIVAIPTETVYGLAANALDPIAISKIFEAKERPNFNPLIVHLAPTADPLQYVKHFPKTAQLLAEAFWPGPLSILLEKHPIIPDIVTAGMDTVVLRKPAHPITQELLNSLDFPLAAPSANKFKNISPTRPEHVQQGLGDAVSFILDGGPSEVGLESTIVDCRTETVKILRFGGVSKDEIESVVGAVEIEIKQHSNPLAPGQLDKHYATKKPLLLVDNIHTAIAEHQDKRLSVIVLGDQNLEDVSTHSLSLDGNMNEAAANLFHTMHHADAEDTDLILAQRMSDEGLGQAINDRLARASQ